MGKKLVFLKMRGKPWHFEFYTLGRRQVHVFLYISLGIGVLQPSTTAVPAVVVAAPEGAAVAAGDEAVP